MYDATRTTTALLNDLQDPANAEVWSFFDARYRPILIAFARRLGASEEDAADVAQETLTKFVEEYRNGAYDRSRGRLRTWLISIARPRIAQIYRRRDVRREQQGVTAAVDLADDAALTRIWDEQRRRAILKEAMRRLREQTRTSDATIEAFELLVLHQRSPAQVAELLNISTHDVYLAKSRVAQRLRDIVAEIEHAWDAEE
ncbi:MAG: sigma-70 family RNA polymerase sigma factor [Planctomycetota bacterium]|nr:sigma-70 family RNA polymerase sigma factor [Planctomycetota bacterium]